MPSKEPHPPETRNQNLVTSPRPPIVAVMGHVDHGKSTLLDYLRKTNVVEKEIGGITQKLSAYEVKHEDEKGVERTITFLDTPGHEAFQSMRGRSAKAADIAILVVSAEDGVKPQTLEAYRAAKEAETPVIVAISKIDKPNANIGRTKSSLIENEIYIEGMGGDIPFVAISSKTGEGISELLDLVLLAAEMSNLNADANANAEGLIVESSVDPKKGVSATLLVKNGTLKKGAYVVSSHSLAPVRVMENFLGEKIDRALPSQPVRISGWNIAPRVGEKFAAFEEKKDAEKAAAGASSAKNAAPLGTRDGENGMHTIPLIIKADTLGAIDAILHEIEKIHVERCALKVISRGVGAISDNDIKIASGSKNAIVLGFGVKIESGARAIAERFGVKAETFDIIYKLAEWLETEIEKVRPRITVEEKKGALKLQRIFTLGKNSHVAGGKVLEGTISLGDKVRILRRDYEIGRGEITDLQEQKVKAKEVSDGRECGIKIATKQEVAQGDVLEAFRLVEK